MADKKSQYISPAKWEAIKNEYITTNTSIRQLATKYKVCVSSIRNHSVKEGWYEKKQEHEIRLDEAITQRYHDEIIQASAESAVRGITELNRATSLALSKVTEALANCDPSSKEDKQVMRSLVSALKDIREMQGEKSPLDIQEQQARIAKLRKECEEQTASDVTIVIQGAEDYAD